MSGTVIAEFARADEMVEAARLARAADVRLIDAYSPYPVDALVGLIGGHATAVRGAMLAGGVGVAACAYGLEWWSAVVNYPVNSGGRPLDSWAAFLMFPFSIGILAAAVCGLVALFVVADLPRLHHPVFAVEGFERMSQDRFALELALPDADARRRDMLDRLQRAGAVSIREVAP